VSFKLGRQEGAGDLGGGLAVDIEADGVGRPGEGEVGPLALLQRAR